MTNHNNQAGKGQCRAMANCESCSARTWANRTGCRRSSLDSEREPPPNRLLSECRPRAKPHGFRGEWPVAAKKEGKIPAPRVASLNDFETSAAECHQTGCGQSLQGGGAIRTRSVVPVERFASPGPERTLPFPPSSVQGASASSGRRTRGASRGASAAGQRPGQAGYPTATLTTIFTTGSGSAQAQHGAWASSGKRIMNWPATTGTGTTSTSAAKSPASCFSS